MRVMYRGVKGIYYPYDVDINDGEIRYQRYEDGKLKTLCEPLLNDEYKWVDNITPVSIQARHDTLWGNK